MLDFLNDILRFDSTSGSENDLVRYIFDKYKPEGTEAELQETGFGRLNIFFKTGEPKIIFCSHLDTVPPFIAPSKDEKNIYGRGSCDAKGQIAYLFEVFRQLISEGYGNIGMLMVSGEEDGSQGAIAANKVLNNCKYIFLGEPTENKLIKASKGNLLVNVNFKGISCHSGYPDIGDSAFDRMINFFNRMRTLDLPFDELLGRTTYNTGQLNSLNAHNVLPDSVSCKVFIRTTFATNKIIKSKIESIADDKTELEYIYGDEPMNFFVTEEFETGIVSFGTDAPAFTNIPNKILYGPGSILDAHTNHEYIRINDLYKAVADVKKIYTKITNEN